MTTFLLVHGGWSQSSVWARLGSELEKRGLSWHALDLPGHGRRERSFWSISVRDYADAVVSEAARIDGPVVAVGHSMGGLSISQAAALAPARFAALVYLAAFLPRNGERLISLAGKDPESDLGKAIRLQPWRARFLLDPRLASAHLFHDCSEENTRAGLAQLQPNPLWPAIGRLRLDAGFDAVPKHTIHCTADRAISIAHQRWMASRYELASSSALETGHMPMYSAPDELAALLEGIAAG